MAQTSVSQIAEQQRLVTESLMAGFSAWTLDGVMRHRSKDCMHDTLPKSMGIPARNNTQYAAFFNNVLHKAIRNFKIHDSVIVNDPVNRAVSVHLTATSDSAVGPYDNEYFFHLKFDESGSEITRIEEMVDSRVTVAFFAKLQAAAKAAAGRTIGPGHKQSGEARL